MLERLTLAKKINRQFSCVKCVLLFDVQCKTVTFLRKNGDLPKGLLIFGKETHSENNHRNR